MDNRLFDDVARKLLLSPEKWKLIGDPFAPAVPRRNDAHRGWRAKHTHEHHYAEALWALRGRTAYGYRGATYSCVPGTVFLFRAREPHDSGYPPGAGRFLHLWVSPLPDAVLARLVAGSDTGYAPVPGTECRIAADEIGVDLPAMFGRSQKTSEPQDEVSRARIRAALALLAARIVEEGYRPHAEVSNESLQRKVVASICRHLEDTDGRDGCLDHLAQLSGYSPFHFLRLFKKYSGRTVGEFVNECRAQKARLLRRQGCSLTEIGERLGFSCPASFSRWHRKHQPWATL